MGIYFLGSRIGNIMFDNYEIQPLRLNMKFLALPLLAATFASADDSCVAPGTCTPPDLKYVAGRDVIPRKQWGNSGGFCGAMSVQSIALSYGLYVSQDLIRKATDKGAGHGNRIEGYEVLHSNIDSTLSNLLLEGESWDYANEQHPQGERYLSWLKGQLANDNGVVQFVLCQGDAHNSYGPIDDPIPYDHIEPFFKLYSDSPLNDTTVYPTDVVSHGSGYAPDGDANLGYFRPFSSLLDDTDMKGNCKDAGSVYMENEMYPCINSDLIYGTAITGIKPNSDRTAEKLALYVDTVTEPDVRNGEAPVAFNGTAVVSSLVPNTDYIIYRYNSPVAYQMDQPDGKMTFSTGENERAKTVALATGLGTFSSDAMAYFLCFKGGDNDDDE